jgi:hypothetical protein
MSSMTEGADEQGGEIQGGPVRIPEPSKAQGHMLRAEDKVDPAEFHKEITSSMRSLSDEQRESLSAALSKAGAAEGAGVQSGATELTDISKMLYWAHTNVPGGIPEVLDSAGSLENERGTPNRTTGKTAVAREEHFAKNQSAGLFDAVRGALMPAVNRLTGGLSRTGGATLPTNSPAGRIENTEPNL